MFVIETNSVQFPTEPWTKREGDVVVTVKRPTSNTDYLCARHISHRRGNDFPFLNYKWNPPLGDRGGKFDDISRSDIWQADWERWDRYFHSFNPKFPDPSAGTCAVFCVVERWQPTDIGLIGFDYVLDNNTGWLHDAAAERAAIESITHIIDLRTSGRK